MLTFDSLKILNYADFYGFFDFISVYLKTIDSLNLKLLIFVGILQVLRFDFQKFRILKILNFHPMCFGMDHIISESYFKGTITEKNYRKMTISWSFSYNSFVIFSPTIDLCKITW